MKQHIFAGADNLEVMSAAENYNRCLLCLVRNGVRDADRILDLGAGTGMFAHELRKLGMQVQCVEPDPQLRERIKARGLPATADLAGIQDRSLDYIYTLNVLEHIDDDQQVLVQCHQKLAPGGRLAVYVPAFALLYSSMDRKIGHVRRYRRSELDAKVRAAGFKVLRNEYVDSAGFLASLLFKYFGNEQGTINRSMLTLYDRYVFPLSRATDRIVRNWFGKNVFLLASKP